MAKKFTIPQIRERLTIQISVGAALFDLSEESIEEANSPTVLTDLQVYEDVMHEGFDFIEYMRRNEGE